MTVSPTQAPAPTTVGVPAQRGLGIAILVVTGLITIQAIVLGVSVATGSPYEHLPGRSFPFGASGGLGLLGTLAWLLVAQWMATAGRAAKANGHAMSYRPWVAWWGWVIPIWNLWAPFRYMKDATQSFPVRHLGLWWATWLVGTLAIATSGESRTIDGVVVATHTLASAPYNAAALTVSWILFARIVWTVSQGSRVIAEGEPSSEMAPLAP